MGKGAPEDFIEKLEGVANSHHDQLVVDVIRAYFFGARFIVEVSYPSTQIMRLKFPLIFNVALSNPCWRCLRGDIHLVSEYSFK